MDYNIYIRTRGSGGGVDSQTTPWQLKTSDGEFQQDTGSGDGGFSVKQAGAFLANPDSAISKVLNTPAGKVGAVIGVICTLAAITGKVISMYDAYRSSATGDFQFQIGYNNFKQHIQNLLHPFSTEVQRQMSSLQIKKDNLKAEQERLLLGGTILNAPYGRYL